MIKLNANAPGVPLPEQWDAYKAGCKLVSPNNKRKLDIIVVGTGLAGASAWAGGSYMTMTGT